MDEPEEQSSIDEIEMRAWLGGDAGLRRRRGAAVASERRFSPHPIKPHTIFFFYLPPRLSRHHTRFPARTYTKKDTVHHELKSSRG